MGEYKRFKADCWTMNMNYEASACITSQTDDELTVQGTFRTNSDLVGIYWNSKDLIEHDLLKYPTDYDYTGTKLTFEFETSNCSLCGGSSLTINCLDGTTYFCDWDTLNPLTDEVNITIPNDTDKFYDIDTRNLLSSDFVVKNKDNETLTGLAGRGFDLGYDKKQGLLINPKPEEIVTITTYKYTPTKHEAINNEGASWGYTKISDNVIPETIRAYDPEDNLYVRGGDAWWTPAGDYTFLPNEWHGVDDYPSNCIVPCNGDFFTNGGYIYYSEYTIDEAEEGSTSITLSKTPAFIEQIGFGKPITVEKEKIKTIDYSYDDTTNTVSYEMTQELQNFCDGVEPILRVEYRETVLQRTPYIEESLPGATSLVLKHESTAVGREVHLVIKYEEIEYDITEISEDDYELNDNTITVNVDNENNLKLIVKYIDDTQMEKIVLTFDEDTHIEVGAIIEGMTEIRKNGKRAELTSLDGKDYYYDQNQEVLIQISDKTFAGGSISCVQAHGLNLDFDNLIAGGYVEKGEYVNEEVTVDATNIESIMIPILPRGFEAYTYKIIDNMNFSCRIYDMTVTGNTFLGYEPEFNLTHNYRLAEGYDDTYHLCPRRLAYMMNRLDYTEWLDLYIGATHYYEKSGERGEFSRINQTDPSNDNYIELMEGEADTRLTYADTLYTKMGTDINTPLTLAFQTWFDDYCKWSKHYGMNNIIVSISMENLQMPDSWKQLLHDGTPGGTGWVPSTNFFSPTNLDARAYIKKVAEACLDILVDNDLPPILQWGEPWWWWQELYPESISIDPENQSSNADKYPGQPPCFYDQSTKDKYFNEKGKELPIYTSSSDEYDPEVIAWLRHQLVDYSNFMRNIVKAYDGGIYTALYFPPSIFDTDRVPKMMQEVNYPADAWNNGQLDFLQLEDYDWVITDDEQHEDIWTFGQKLNIPNSKIHYFSGYNQYPNDTPRIWPLIKKAAEDAVFNNMAEVYIWAGTQIRRDNIIMTTPVKPLPVTDNKELAIPLLNIIVLTGREEVIRWLVPDLAEIKEINETNTIRKITLTYPLEEGIHEEENPWFSQGNKIFIPSVFGLKNCLYVINTSYVLDYWEDNTVTIEAEEVLTELNNQVIGVYTDTLINETQLKTWFGKFYEIDKIDKLLSNKNKVNALGTVTLMNLFRTIEENTERVFITEYFYENNKIKRKLSLLKESTLRQTAGTEYLDLNYNLDSLELEVNEEKTYTSVAPLLNIQNNSTINNSYITVSEDEQNTANSKKVYEDWLKLEVEPREYIPMIRKKESDGSISTTAYWYAPFRKRKDKIYIEYEGYSNSHYQEIYPPETGKEYPNPLPKMGTVSTSETDPYSIYNTLANHLLEKINTKYEIKLKVKDITDRLGLENLGYNIYETLYVKIPGFDYYVPAYITKTTKNPHLPGDDSITIETDVKNTHSMKDTEIISNNKIIPANSVNNNVTGVLVTTDSDPIADEMVSISIRLDEIYEEVADVTPAVNEFDPYTQEYIFSYDEIKELEKNLRHDNIKHNMKEEYLMTDIKGVSYSVPYDWCLCIYYSLLQTYINRDVPLNTAKFDKTVAVHYYPDVMTLLKTKGNNKYFPSAYYYYLTYFRNYYKELGLPAYAVWDFICSNEIQNTTTCVASSISNATAFTFNYRTEGQITDLFGGTKGLTIPEIQRIAIPVLKKIGFDTSIVTFTEDNITKYINNRDCALVTVEASRIGYEGSGYHEILLYAWRRVNGVLYCMYFDSNYPIFDPAVTQLYDLKTKNTITFDNLRKAIVMYNDDGQLRANENMNVTKSMIVIKQTADQLPETLEDKTVPVINIDPATQTYKFKSTELENRWYTLMRTKNKDNHAFLNNEFNITTEDGKNVKLNSMWIFSLACEYMSNFDGSHTPKEDITVSTGSDSLANAMHKYCTNLGKINHMFTVSQPKVFTNQNKSLISYCLFWLGAFEPSESLIYNYSDSEPFTLQQVGEIISAHIGGLEWELVDINNTTISQTNNNAINVTYLSREFLIAIEPESKRFYDSHKSILPVVVWGLRDGYVIYRPINFTGVIFEGNKVNDFGGGGFATDKETFISASNSAVGKMLKINFE